MRRTLAAPDQVEEQVLYGYGFVLVLELALLVYCALNIITTPEDQVRNLPKLLWLVLVLFFPIVGGVAWLVAGRPQRPAGTLPHAGGLGPLPPAGPARGSGPDDDEEFLRQLRQRAEEQRRRAKGEEPDAPA